MIELLATLFWGYIAFLVLWLFCAMLWQGVLDTWADLKTFFNWLRSQYERVLHHLPR